MQSRLEPYLAQLTTHLGRLPQEVRDADLAEVRMHLEAMVEAEMELGSAPGEACSAALKRFGDPRILAMGLYREWRRSNRMRDQSDFARAFWLHVGTDMVRSSVWMLGALAMNSFLGPEQRLPYVQALVAVTGLLGVAGCVWPAYAAPRRAYAGAVAAQWSGLAVGLAVAYLLHGHDAIASAMLLGSVRRLPANTAMLLCLTWLGRRLASKRQERTPVVA